MTPGRPEAAAPLHELRVDVRPAWPFRLWLSRLDGVVRRRGAALQRLLHVGSVPVLVGVVQPSPWLVRFGARAACPDAAAEAIARMRFASAVDDDLREFHDRFRRDPVIGRVVRAQPGVRVLRRPDPWEALAWAVTEQLIELDRAVEIQRRMVRALGRRCPLTGLRDVPTPAAVAGAAPARLEGYGLAGGRALTLRRAAREVSCGRVDLRGSDLRRLAAIPGIGPWTLEMLAVTGQGRHDVVAAGDLGFLKIVGRLQTGSPHARAPEADVRAFFARYGEWQALAGQYLRLAASTGGLPLRTRFGNRRYDRGGREPSRAVNGSEANTGGIGEGPGAARRSR